MGCSFVLCFSLIQQAGIWSRHSIEHIFTEDEDLSRRIHGFQSSLPTSFLFFFFPFLYSLLFCSHVLTVSIRSTWSVPFALFISSYPENPSLEKEICSSWSTYSTDQYLLALFGYSQTLVLLQGLLKCRFPRELGCECCSVWAGLERGFSKAQLAAGFRLRDEDNIVNQLCE